MMRKVSLKNVGNAASIKKWREEKQREKKKELLKWTVDSPPVQEKQENLHFLHTVNVISPFFPATLRSLRFSFL